MNRVKAILFDCDGVLIDSEPMGCGSLAQAVTEAGHPMSQHEARAVFSGNAARDSRNWMASNGLDAATVFARSDDILFEMFETSVPYIPGIEEVLRDFPLKRAICSNSSVLRLELSICRTPLAAYFGRHVYSAEHVAQPKPAPDMALHACRELGVLPHEAIFIDDNIHGIRCAREAGCIAVGFVGPSDDRHDHDQTLRAAGADHVVNGMSDFHALLTTLTTEIFEVI